MRICGKIGELVSQNTKKKPLLLFYPTWTNYNEKQNQLKV